jgi:hypothetical protein
MTANRVMLGFDDGAEVEFASAELAYRAVSIMQVGRRLCADHTETC